MLIVSFVLQHSAEWSKVPDVAHFLLQDAQNNPGQFPWLTGDSILAIVAGSEPTAAVLIGLFLELAKDPRHATIILQETKDINLEDHRTLAQGCPHLEGTIFEALRLYPALPTGGNRKTLKEGITIGGIYIPPETTVVAPRFCISRRKLPLPKKKKFFSVADNLTQEKIVLSKHTSSSQSVGTRTQRWSARRQHLHLLAQVRP